MTISNIILQQTVHWKTINEKFLSICTGAARFDGRSMLYQEGRSVSKDLVSMSSWGVCLTSLIEFSITLRIIYA